MATEHFDIIVLGAGLSGICMAHYLKKECPDKRFTIIEGRENIGGTWDLFRYPGIRSDSAMSTFGFKFKPWNKKNAIADGHEIRDYIEAAAKEDGTFEQIQFSHRAKKATWSSKENRWILEVENLKNGVIKQMTCTFFIGCTGYYKYEAGYTPKFKNVEKYQGQFIHPQKWPEDLDYKDKKVVVIGSGATAITLLPAMTKNGASHVTMLQRSPSYIMPIPNEKAIEINKTNLIPNRLYYGTKRWKDFLGGFVMYTLSRKYPELIKKQLFKITKSLLPEDFEVEKHFRPAYNPWEQRLCVAPNGDFFMAIKEGKANVVTSHIDCFIEKGIQLKSGEILEADIVVSATGLVLQIFGGIEITIDGKVINVSDNYSYKGIMLSDIPNMASIAGYTNASWTLKAELSAEYLCRLFKYMDKKGFVNCVPRYDGEATNITVMDGLKSGYIERQAAKLPLQGQSHPWIVSNNYLDDIKILKYDKLNDGLMQFK